MIPVEHRAYTQSDRMQEMVEKEGYTSAQIEINYKLAGRCPGKNYQSFSFSGTKSKQKFTDNVYCEILFLVMEDCSILQTHLVKP